MLPYFFFNDTATTEIYTLSLHDALPILEVEGPPLHRVFGLVKVRIDAAAGTADKDEELVVDGVTRAEGDRLRDRKSTRLNSSHANISYAVFCLQKKTRRGVRKGGRGCAG